jgi:hypothetical protein
MAKDQNLSLNPTKISGACGRLMCCLKYENDYYVEQHNERPHGPIPPSSFASSRTPICLSSIRVLKF